MQDIIQGSRATLKVLGKQVSRPGVKYRLIHYILFQECDEGYLAFNVVTGALLLISAEEYRMLSNSNSFFVDTVDEKGLFEGMIQRWFLIPDYYNEYALVNQIRCTIKMVCATSTISTYTILPTTSCNARCFYCFEASFPHHTMTKSTANDVIGFIKNNYKGSPILIRWFGGEPLLGTSTIDYICAQLNEVGILFRSRIVTNGYLFTSHLVEKSTLNWHLEEAMVTIDGLEQQYNTIKNYKHHDGKGSPFYIVLNNIELLLKANVFVEIRLNIDTHNAETMDDLIDELFNRFNQYPNFHIFTVVLHSNGRTAVPHTPDIMKYLYSMQNSIERKLYLLGIAKKEYEIPAFMKPESVKLKPAARLYKAMG